MSVTVNIYEAKSQLSKLVERAEEGEEIIIARAGRPVVHMTALPTRPSRRSPGAWKGKVWIAEDFDETPGEIIDEWYSDVESE